ncbi:hypothetical protein [Burkholderia stagnalis]|uniref:hypothetical protein n=1 Tax=Burkholderia stagnalis TaxID=1503054 RepID=UPI000B2040C1|nr:hypothetical protein [Burkholderia stagnalis]
MDDARQATGVETNGQIAGWRQARIAAEGWLDCGNGFALFHKNNDMLSHRQ